MFEDDEEQQLQIPATASGVDINSLLTAMMEKVQILTEVQESFRAENEKHLAEVQEMSRTENQKTSG